MSITPYIKVAKYSIVNLRVSTRLPTGTVVPGEQWWTICWWYTIIRLLLFTMRISRYILSAWISLIHSVRLMQWWSFLNIRLRKLGWNILSEHNTRAVKLNLMDSWSNQIDRQSVPIEEAETDCLCYIRTKNSRYGNEKFRPERHHLFLILQCAIWYIAHLRYTFMCDKIYIDVSGEILMSLPKTPAMSKSVLYLHQYISIEPW